MAQSHRGLPPPAAMALPSASSSSSIGPIPPHLWQNSEETVRSLLQIKTEEQRYATEQERTKQEELRFRTRETELRTRETELTMLREALQGGVPGHVVAMIFASSNRISDSIQDYSATEYQQQSRAPPPPAPALRREPRLIGPAVHNSAPVPPQSMPPPVVGPTWDAHQPGYSSYAARGSTNRSSQSGPSGQSGQPQPPPPPQGSTHRSALPRINTNEIQGQKSSQMSGPTPILNPSPMPHPTPQSSSGAEAPLVTRSPSIYFHYWQPPSTQVGSQPSGQRASSPPRQLGSPFPHHPPPSHLSGSEVSSSPKRRKMTSGQPYSPPYQAASGPGTTNVTPARRRAHSHSRQRSDTATSGMRPFETFHRPATRQRRSDTVSGQVGDEHSGSTPGSDPMQTSPDAGSGSQQQGSGQEQGGVPLPPSAQPQQQQPPSRSYSPGPDRSRELPYPGPPGGEGGQASQGGNGRH